MMHRLKRPVIVLIHGINALVFCVLATWIGAFALLVQDGKLPYPPRDNMQYSGVRK